MASYTRSYAALLLTALLVPRSVLAIPTPVQDLDSRATSTETPAANITPEIIDHGALDQAEIDVLVANLTATSKIQARQTSNVTVGTSTNGAFLSYINGLDLPGETAQCPEFMVEGPILGIDAAMGSSHIRSLKLTSISGNTTDITGLENVADPDPGAFEFGANERITEFVVLESSLSQVLGFTFKTDAGQEYKALSTVGLEAKEADNITYNSLPVGSGIIARIYGTKCDVGIISAFGIDFLDDLASISITNMTYSGFTNNIAPSGEGSLLNVGSQILDNRNSSVQQQMTLTTSDAVTKSHTASVSSNWNVGNSVAIKAGASIPFIANTEVTNTVNWQVGGASDDSETTAEIRTSTSTFQLNCPAKKFCVASATFQTFKLDVNLEATFTAETKSGNKYNWVQSGTYKGSDSLSMKLTVDEADNAS